MPSIMHSLILISLFCCTNIACAADQIFLKNIQTRTLPGNKAQILLEFSEPPPNPVGFAISEPAKMVFDFPGVQSNLNRGMSNQKLILGVITGFNFVQSAEKTRLILDVLNIVPYTVDTDRNTVVITLDNALQAQNVVQQGATTISSIDFRRGESGEGRVVIDFASDSVPIDFSETDGEMIAVFRGATIPDNLLRRFDVTDFGTNIQKVVIERKSNDVVMHVYANGDYDNIAYQLDKQYIVEVRPLSANALQEIKTQKFKFSGERISLNFQDISIRAVLQLIADFTGLNMVVSDTVQGNLTLRLDNIPWDQALAFILQSKGLGKREEGNVILIAPNEEITAREQLELAAQQQVQSLAPLESEFIQINYAKAADMVTMIKDTNNNLLSARGQISVDVRTNTLLVKDTAENILSIRQLVDRLDIPVRQVMIEAQIVQTTDGFTDAFGVQLTGAATAQLGKYTLGMAPTLDQAATFAASPTSKVATSDNLFFDFSNANALGTLGLALAKLPGGILLDLELQASELETKSKTVARPKLMTLDQQQATIETGTEIPYTTVAQDGATPTTTFKKAVLKLDVTPQITPNNKISMNLTVNQDTPGSAQPNGQVAINTTSMTTNILVDDGETIVLGGIFQLSDSFTTNYIPYLSDLPIVGQVFRNTTKVINRTEILFFITPRIVQSFFSKQ